MKKQSRDRMKNTKEKKIYIEVLRILACFFVIFNHTEGCALFYNTGGITEWKTWVYLGASYIVRTAVPIFLLIAGTCLLGKEESVRTILSKRVFKTFLILLMASLLYYCLNSPVGMIDFLQKFLKGEVLYAYWYLYLYLGILLMLPFLRAIVKGIDYNVYKYLLVCYFIFVNVIPMLNNLTGDTIDIALTGSFEIPILIKQSTFYLLIGYWVDNIYDISKVKVKTIIIMISISFLAIFYECMNRFEEGVPIQGYIMLFDWILALFIFIIIKYIFTRITLKKQICRIIIFMGSLTFGIYLLDLIVKPYILPSVEKIFLGLPIYIISIIYSVVSMIICGTITYGIKFVCSRICQSMKKGI